MSFKIIDGTTEKGTPHTLFRGYALSADQFKIIQDIIEFHKGETKLTSKQLITANQSLRCKKYMPYFIGRNLSAKIKNTPGIYNLSVFKLAASASKTAAAVVEPKAKKEAKPKREAKSKCTAPPVNTEPKLIEAPAPETVTDLTVIE